MTDPQIPHTWEGRSRCGNPVSVAGWSDSDIFLKVADRGVLLNRQTLLELIDTLQHCLYLADQWEAR